MALTEFNIIEHFFNIKKDNRSDVILGIGDDCALLKAPVGKLLAVSTDTMVEEVHFLKNTDAKIVGYRALATSLSDLAAMGAEPAWIMLALTLPKVDEDWLTDFSKGFFELIDHYSLQLVGGNLTQGQLAITTQVFGFVEPNQIMQRQGAGIGDFIYVTGHLGDAGLALAALMGKKNLANDVLTVLQQRLYRPIPRIDEARVINQVASAAIDISDSLFADLNHILQSSGVGATVLAEKLPLSPALKNSLSLPEAWEFALTAGDDYELCFTVPEHKQAQWLKLCDVHKINCSYIGKIEAQPGLRVLGSQQELLTFHRSAYQHFKE